MGNDFSSGFSVEQFRLQFSDSCKRHQRFIEYRTWEHWTGTDYIAAVLIYTHALAHTHTHELALFNGS